MSEFPDLRQPSAFDPTIKVGQTTPNLPTDPQPVRETAPVPEDLQEKLEAATICADSRDCLACMDTIALIKRIAQEKARVRELEHRCKVFVKGLENEEEDCGALHDQIEALEQRAAKAEANFNALNTKFSRLLDRFRVLSAPVGDEDKTEEIRRLEADIAYMREIFADPFEDGWGDDERRSEHYESPKYEDGVADWICGAWGSSASDGDVREFVQASYRAADIITRLENALIAARVSASSDVKGDGDGKS